MANVGIDLKGVDQVLQAFSYRDTPYFAVYSGKDLKFYNADDDMEAANNMLRENLEVVEKNGSTAPYKIFYYSNAREGRLHPDDLVGSNTFRLNSPFSGSYDQRLPVQVSGVANQGFFEKVFSEKISELEKKISELEKKIEELFEEEEEEESIGDPVISEKPENIIVSILKDENIRNTIIPIVGSLFGTFQKTISNNERQAAAVAGMVDVNNSERPIDNIDELDRWISGLLAHGMVVEDFERLLRLAENSPSEFKFYLNFLRKKKD